MFPTTLDVMLSNPEKKPINWHLDEKAFENDKVFAIHPVIFNWFFILFCNLLI